jgi:predicted cupin superfamily sugar epimerase
MQVESAMMNSITQLVEELELLPHPEGGWFRETYRSTETIPRNGLPDRFDGPRSQATAIYFLLTSESFSALHRIKSDEQWHFYTGSALTVHVFHPGGQYEAIKLGSRLEQGETFQAVVLQGCWFGATVDTPDSFALVGCSVAPGFDFSDFEMAHHLTLSQQYPRHSALIERLTRSE